ncbi:class I ribonucleotide reductase maintenance protein YfaE [Balneatrix alpica]|uniref:Class I ribonucleotide reductase maintenance protein YfaE n=1 Tax=Balneatrix alpica TaxID=75684 RepID=A0ABV5Z6F8_9GAMM|nr:class I ribonucleotide reductase maintenance protein YfaE [Balneatrix alpica]
MTSTFDPAAAKLRVWVQGRHEFHYSGAPTLLDALEQQQLPVRYNCRGGYCGCCRVRLQQGQVRWLQESLVELAENEILSCCCVPLGPIKIELPE